MPVVGGTWKLASKSEWDSMISAAGSGEALFNGFSSVGGTDMLDGHYWSSEMDESGVNGRIIQEYHGWSGFVSNAQTVPVRACLTFKQQLHRQVCEVDQRHQCIGDGRHQ